MRICRFALVAIMLLVAGVALVPGAAAGQAERCFPETGKCVGGLFYQYWLANGGLAQQGLPITEEFDEYNPTDGKTYRTQYFERARFELHPEHAGTRFEVLMGLLGREQFTILFEDDFADPASGWFKYEQEDGSSDYTNGAYRLQAIGAKRYIYSFPGGDFGDVRVEVDATSAAGTTDSALHHVPLPGRVQLLRADDRQRRFL